MIVSKEGVMDERITDFLSLQYILTCLTVELGRQHTKAPLAATISPFMSSLHPPNHDVNDVKVDHTSGVYVPYSFRDVRDDL